MEPGKEEIEPRPFVGHFAHPCRGNCGESPEEIGLDAGRRLEDKDATGSNQIRRNLRDDLHRQEQPGENHAFVVKEIIEYYNSARVFGKENTKEAVREKRMRDGRQRHCSANKTEEKNNLKLPCG